MNFEWLRFFKQSFRVKVIFISIIIMLATCLCLTGFFVYNQSASLEDSLEERGTLLASVLAHSARIGIFAENRELLVSPVDGILKQPEVVRVSVFGSDGKLLYAAGGEPGESEVRPEAPPPKIDDGLSQKISSSESAVHFDFSESLQVWSAVFSSPEYSTHESLIFREQKPAAQPRLIGFVSIDISKGNLNLQIYEFLLKAVIITLGAVIAGGVLVFLVINGIIQPLNRLASGIKSLGEEGDAEPVKVDTQDEIGRLAEAFNELSESLRKRKAENLQLEMQLRQAQKLEALGTLAGGIAHDFNNVLSPIFGYTEMAMDDLSKNDPLYNNLKQVLSAAGRARELVKQILAFSRQSETQKVPLQIQFVLKEALKLLRASLPSTIVITEQIDKNCGSVIADPTDIHRIVMNLGTNAYHAMRDHGGELKVVLEEEELDKKEIRRRGLDLAEGGYARLSVSDTGSGMDEDTLQRIFDPYFTTKPAGEGTGMGLAMVHGIVKACGGDIRVESRSGEGSVFEIYFPEVEIDAASGEAVCETPVPCGTEHILLVDDEIQVAYMLKQMLEQLGYRVTMFTDSPRALEVFSAQPDTFDLIITDQTMPYMTGDELAEEAIRLRKDIPVILCTGFSEKLSEQKAKNKGIRAFLMKPVLKQKMAVTIRNVLDSTGNTQT
ncbi:MAG: response regulator [Desulfobacteraceae bacterium]|nr:response regulator [Desulfobacteraceae bacterium]